MSIWSPEVAVIDIVYIQAVVVVVVVVVVAIVIVVSNKSIVTS